MERSELAIVAPYAWMCDEGIRLKLKARGYARSVTAIHLKLKRMKFKSDPNFYSVQGLADALGIASHKVTRWIRAGHLVAQRRGTKRTKRQGGNIYLIWKKCTAVHPRAPAEIDFCKIDGVWLFDVITNGFRTST